MTARYDDAELSLVRLLCEAVGAPPKTRALTICWDATSRLTVTAEYYPEPLTVVNDEIVTAVKVWKTKSAEEAA